MLKLGATIVAAATVTLSSLPPRRAETTAPQESVEAAIRGVHEEMRAAAGRLDANALYAYVADTDTPPIIENGRLEPTRASALQSTAAGFRGVTHIAYAYTREDITVLSPETALWVGQGSATATLADGREIVAPFAETIVFVLRDGAWKVLHAHRSSPTVGG